MASDLLESSSEPVRKAMEYLLSIYSEEREEYLTFSDAPIFHALEQIDSPLIFEYIETAEKEIFWEPYEMWDKIHRIYHLCELLKRSDTPNWRENDHLNSFLDEMASSQTITGKFNWEEFIHEISTLIFVLARPNSIQTHRAISFMLDNEIEFEESFRLSFAILSLCHYDYPRYSTKISEFCSKLVEYQNDDGSFGRTPHKIPLRNTVFATIALSRTGKYTDELKDTRDWIVNKQLDDNGWSSSMGEYSGSTTIETSQALLALCCLGEGPKVPRERHQWQLELKSQRIERTRPRFVKTYPPIAAGVKELEIREEIKKMISEANDVFRVISPYFDMLNEELIDIPTNSEAEVRILTRPKGDFSGERSKLGKSVIDALNSTDGIDVRKNSLLHCRLAISDNSRVLISSADFTRAQLVDEFNAGILTGYPEAVEGSIAFFDQIWESSEKFS